MGNPEYSNPESKRKVQKVGWFKTKVNQFKSLFNIKKT